MSTAQKLKDLKPGMTFLAVIPFSRPKVVEIHIDHVLPSIHKDRKLIIYRVGNKRTKVCYEFMCTSDEFETFKILKQL